MSNELAQNARELSERYPIWLCDVWGVVHNGVAAYPRACEALASHRKKGGVVIYITNAPRPSGAIYQQLTGLNVPKDAYDSVVSSGDVTRELVSNPPGRKVFFLGPERDYVLKEGLDVEWTGIADADVVLCSGLYDDQTESPDDYDDMLADIRKHNLPMMCANPDLVVQYGDRLIPCAGALAQKYAALGGRVEMAGKPYSPIYDVALKRARSIAGDFDRAGDVVAIGDGMKTDITGARDNDLPVFFVTGGIHDDEIGPDASADDMAAIARQAVDGVRVIGAMRNLEW